MSEMSETFPACAELGQIAKLSPGVLVGYAELVQFEKTFAEICWLSDYGFFC